MFNLDLLPIYLGFVGLITAFLLYKFILNFSAGEGKIVEIADEIHLGAMTFIKKEYSILFVFSLLLTLGVFIGLGPESTLAFIIGALCSSATGFIGMYTSTKANVRTTNSANKFGLSESLTVAFFGGSIMGLTVAAMGLLGLGVLYFLFGGDPKTASVIHGFSRFKNIDSWPIADEVFTHFPFLHGVDAPMYYVALMTFILIFSSVALACALF